MLTCAVEQWIGNAAAVLSGAWGAVTRRSEQSGYSRTAIYTHAGRVVQAVASEHAFPVHRRNFVRQSDIASVINHLEALAKRILLANSHL